MADTIKTIEEKLTTVKTSLSNIKTSIVNKGQIPTGDITTYATAIDNISTGVTPTVTISITENGTHDVINYASAEVKVESSGGVQYIPREVTAEGNLRYPSANFTFSLPDNLTHSISDLKYIFYECTSLTSVNFNNVTSIGEYGLSWAFEGCTSLSSLSFPALTSSLSNNGVGQFSDILRGVTGCTVHFPSNLESVIGKWYDVTDGFSGIDTTVLFDLPVTS